MRVLWRIAANKPALLSALFLAGLVVLATLANVLHPDSPWKMVSKPFLAPSFGGRLMFGTDMLGRDVGAGLLYGARVSLMIGLVSTLVALAIGVPLGAASGYFGGLVDEVIMSITEFFQTIPSFALAIVLVAVFSPSVFSIVSAIGIVSWPPVTRLVRGQVLSLKTREYVQAATTIGMSTPRIIFTQVLPNTLAPIIVISALMVGSAILLESSLSFLGLGDPDMMSWGYIVGAGRTRLVDAWWISFFPGLAIFLTVLALNLLGEGLNEALNPRGQGR